jgi:alkanesulfonate monooxygenase SsuD/methylene tetrahydromethanopterin reductase-like flavin-dependent oxidoreductase (luciferase family)
MRLGVVVPQLRPWRQLAQDFRLMEELGYEAAYVYDHLTHPTAVGQWLGEAFSTLAAAAGVTERIELGTLVASATLHSPVSLARRAATVQDVSDGRLVLGLGAGAPFCAMADRGEKVTIPEMAGRFADVLVGMRAVFAGATEWTGRTRSYAGLETLPLPDGTAVPYVLVAAHGPKALALAAEHGDGWNTYGGPYAARATEQHYWKVLAEQTARFTDACERVGRDPAEPRRSLLLGFGTVRPTQSVAAYEDAIGRATELGFDELVVYGPFGEPGYYFHSEVEVHAEVLAAQRRAA